MKCPECDKKIEKDSVFCCYCGLKLLESQEVIIQENVSVIDNENLFSLKKYIEAYPCFFMIF